MTKSQLQRGDRGKEELASIHPEALVVSVARLPAAGQPRLPRVRRGRLSARVASVFEGRPGQRALIVGQAPGIVEGAERRPWRGRAGRTLRAWLELDEAAFYETFYCVSVTRCYPGKHTSGRGDRPATVAEMDLCAFWLSGSFGSSVPS